MGLNLDEATSDFQAMIDRCIEDHIPNETTEKTLRDSKSGVGVTHYKDADDLFSKLGLKEKTTKRWFDFLRWLS